MRAATRPRTRVSGASGGSSSFGRRQGTRDAPFRGSRLCMRLIWTLLIAAACMALYIRLDGRHNYYSQVWIMLSSKTAGQPRVEFRTLGGAAKPLPTVPSVKSEVDTGDFHALNPDAELRPAKVISRGVDAAFDDITAISGVEHADEPDETFHHEQDVARAASFSRSLRDSSVMAPAVAPTTLPATLPSHIPLTAPATENYQETSREAPSNDAPPKPAGYWNALMRLRERTNSNNNNINAGSQPTPIAASTIAGPWHIEPLDDDGDSISDGASSAGPGAGLMQTPHPQQSNGVSDVLLWEPIDYADQGGGPDAHQGDHEMDGDNGYDGHASGKAGTTWSDGRSSGGEDGNGEHGEMAQAWDVLDEDTTALRERPLGKAAPVQEELAPAVTDSKEVPTGTSTATTMPTQLPWWSTGHAGARNSAGSGTAAATADRSMGSTVGPDSDARMGQGVTLDRPSIGSATTVTDDRNARSTTAAADDSSGGYTGPAAGTTNEPSRDAAFGTGLNDRSVGSSGRAGATVATSTTGSADRSVVSAVTSAASASAVSAAGPGERTGQVSTGQTSGVLSDVTKSAAARVPVSERQRSGRLVSLRLASGHTFTPPFDPRFTRYLATVPFSVGSAVLLAKPADPSAVVRWGGVARGVLSLTPNGEWSTSAPLVAGEWNDLVVEVSSGGSSSDAGGESAHRPPGTHQPSPSGGAPAPVSYLLRVFRRLDHLEAAASSATLAALFAPTGPEGVGPAIRQVGFLLSRWDLDLRLDGPPTSPDFGDRAMQALAAAVATATEAADRSLVIGVLPSDPAAKVSVAGAVLRPGQVAWQAAPAHAQAQEHLLLVTAAGGQHSQEYSLTLQGQAANYTGVPDSEVLAMEISALALAIERRALVKAGHPSGVFLGAAPDSPAASFSRHVATLTREMADACLRAPRPWVPLIGPRPPGLLARTGPDTLLFDAGARVQSRGGSGSVLRPLLDPVTGQDMASGTGQESASRTGQQMAASAAGTSSAPSSRRASFLESADANAPSGPGYLQGEGVGSGMGEVRKGASDRGTGGGACRRPQLQMRRWLGWHPHGPAG
eukprot:jgi/Mesvir1/1049/Mv17572-RA.1